MYKFINTYGNPGFSVLSPSGATVYSSALSKKFQTMKEYHKDEYYTRITHAGIRRSFYRWTHYKFVFDFSASLFLADATIIKQLLNYHKQGNTLILYPDFNLKSRRYFEVMPDPDEEREIYLLPMQADTLCNSGFMLTFLTTKPKYDLNWLNLNEVPITAATVGEEA